MKQPILYFWGVLISGVCILPNVGHAASLYIDPPINELNRGDAVTLSVRLNVEEGAQECINAVDAVLTYTSNIEPVDVSIGDSIFSVWVEEPIINRADRTITFAGGIPNGYCGRVSGDPRLTNTIAKLVFRSPGFTIGGGDTSETDGSVTFTDQTTAYHNDGRGTKASLATYGATFELKQRAGAEMQNAWRDEITADQTQPEEFSITLTNDDTTFSGRYYIVFNTTDKQTGIDQYQVMEEPLAQFGSFRWGRADAPWIEARSPYVLKDQSLNSIIRVKAIDKAGNEYVANLIPDDSKRTLSHTQVSTLTKTVGAGLLLLIVGIGVWWYLRRRKTQSTEYSDETVIENQSISEDEVSNGYDK